MNQPNQYIQPDPAITFCFMLCAIGAGRLMCDRSANSATKIPLLNEPEHREEI